MRESASLISSRVIYAPRVRFGGWPQVSPSFTGRSKDEQGRRGRARDCAAINRFGEGIKVDTPPSFRKTTLRSCLFRQDRDYSGGPLMAEGAPHLPFAIPSGSTKLGGCGSFPIRPAGEVHPSKAVVNGLKPDTRHRAYFSSAAGRSKGKGISSFTRGCDSSESRITAWT
jgi:hypothetical protein